MKVAHGRALSGYFIDSNFAHPMPARMPSFEQEVRKHPYDVVCNLLGRAEHAAEVGNQMEAARLNQEAERAFKLALAA